MLLILLIETTAPFEFIMKSLVGFEFLCSEIPSEDDENDAEEGPPEAYSETPNHTKHLIFELIHHKG